VKDALQRLDDAGYVAYVVGGSVRDFLLGRESKDHDIATSAEPDELCRLFPEAITVGKAFGVIKVPIAPDVVLEIATFRKDLEYHDHRHPQGVLFAGPTEDARRRDFTVNALFLDHKAGRILDTVEGYEDLQNHLIRAIGDPLERFKEDALRLLRAVRFTTTLAFTLDPATADALRARAKLITKVSAERVRDELTLMLTGPNPSLAVQLLSDVTLLRLVLPEVEDLRGRPLWKQTLRSLEFLARKEPKRPPALAWAALLRNIAKPATVAKAASAIATRLKMSRADHDQIVHWVEEHTKFKDVFQMRESTLTRFVRQPGFEQLLALHAADAAATDGNLAFHEFAASRYDEQKRIGASDKLLTGEDLIQLGLRPGPRFSEILRVIEDLALERKLASKEEALEYVVKHFVG
jgi:poly(A) polymerase